MRLLLAAANEPYYKESIRYLTLHASLLKVRCRKGSTFISTSHKEGYLGMLLLAVYH